MLTVPPLNEMFLEFEAIGDNCEFGLVQRHFGADPISLLRFAGFEISLELRLDHLISAIETGFKDLGRPEAIKVSVGGPPGHEEYLVRETTYHLMYHTFQSPNHMTLERIRVREADRLNFMKRMFLESLADARKLLVWKSNTAPPARNMARLLSALRRYGPNSLLWVSEGDADNLPPTVTFAEDGLLRGYIERLAPYHDATDISYAGWEALCATAYKLWKQGDTGQREAMAVTVLPDNSAPLISAGGGLSGAIPHKVHDYPAERKMPRVACIMMQKDERFLLKPWLAYYGHLFGFENLFVFDNGSELDEVQDILAEHERKGVTVNRDHTSREAYRAKGDIIGNQITLLDACEEYDFLIPLDCDEFIVLKGDTGYTPSRDYILAYLESLIGESQALRFPYQLANHPLQPDIYHYFTFFKSFFPAGTFKWMDHGHHEGQSRKAEGFKDTHLIHLHFHCKPLDLQVEQARQSWVGSVSTDDRRKLADYRGPSAHLVSYFLQTKKEYYAGFLDMVHFYLPEFRELLKSLNAPLDLPTEPVEEDLVVKVGGRDAASSFDGHGTTILVPPQTPSTVGFVVSEFNETRYLAANPDLARSDMRPTAHYCLYGFREGRPLRPPTAPLGATVTHRANTKQESAIPALSLSGPASALLQMIAITSYLANEGPIRPGPDGKRCIEFGAGGHHLPGWLHTDLDATGHVVHLDVTQPFPIPDRVFDYVYSEHMIEHITFAQGRFMIRECFRIMKAGSIIRIVTPSIGFLLRLFSEDRSDLENRYIEWATNQFMSGAPKALPSLVFNNFVRQWGHQFIYDRATLRFVLSEAGFVDIKEHRIGHSDHEKLRDLETVARMPEGFLELESMILEGMRPPVG
jgi:predicted SAM-dependent methyltransferase